MHHPKRGANIILFTGLVRHPDMFERQLELIHGLDGLDRRILATWTEEYEANESLLNNLTERFGLEVIHCHQPPFVKGYFLHQMHALENGLACVGDEDVVCKSRADLIIAPEALAHVLRKDRTNHRPGLHQDLYIDNLIDVIEAQISTPFMYDDIAFCGIAADLRRFINMEMMFQVVYRCASFAHERYFGDLFSSRVAFLKDHFRQSWVFGGDDALTWTRLIGNDYRRRMTAFAMRDRDYGLMMALSYLVTSQMFCFDWGPRRDFFSFRGATREVATIGPRWGARSFDEHRSLSSVFAAPEHYSQPDGAISANAGRFFARIVDGDFEDCAIGRNIRSGLDGVRSASLRELQTLADMKGFTVRAVAQSKQIVHDLLPRFQQKAHELARLNQVKEAETLVNGLINHLAA